MVVKYDVYAVRFWVKITFDRVTAKYSKCFIYHHHHHHHHITSLKAGRNPVSKYVLRTFSSFRFQYYIFSLWPFSSCLLLLPRILVTFIFPPIFPSITCFRRQFLLKMWPIQLAFLFLLHVGYSSPPWLHVILPYLTHDWSNWFSPSTHELS